MFRLEQLLKRAMEGEVFGSDSMRSLAAQFWAAREIELQPLPGSRLDALVLELGNNAQAAIIA